MLSSKQAPTDNVVPSDLEEELECSSLHADLLHRAHLLLTDLTNFESYLKSQKKEDAIDIRQFKSNVKSEAQTLERIAPTIPEPILADDKEETESRKDHALLSSNLPFYEAVWAEARRCQGVVALRKRIYDEHLTEIEGASSPGHHRRGKETAFPSNDKNIHQRRKKSSAIVDVVADEGQTWIKVSTVTVKRLLFDLAKEGWEGCDSESDEDDFDSNISSAPFSGASRQAGGGLEIVRLARNMMRVATITRVRYRHPRIRFILPRIPEGQLDKIDEVINRLRSIGLTVQCAAGLGNNVVPLTIPLSTMDSPDIARRFTRMIPRAYPVLTPILNIDCTILLALISDISHFRSKSLPPAPKDNYHATITRQIRSEETTLLLQIELFPILGGRQMQCTLHATRRMREIVQTMGTATEKARADILLGDGDYVGLSDVDLHRKLESLSDCDIPVELRLPLITIDFDAGAVLTDQESGLAARLMSKVAEHISEINKSVFLYGWSEGIVTVSSNRVVAKEIERVVCRVLDESEKGLVNDVSSIARAGPDIWVCETARSLIGKQRQSSVKFTKA